MESKQCLNSIYGVTITDVKGKDLKNVLSELRKNINIDSVETYYDTDNIDWIKAKNSRKRGVKNGK